MTRSQRDVALKILPSSFASDPERLARFEREAMTLATLNHPNVAHVYGIEADFGGRPTFIARKVSRSPNGRSVFAAVPEGNADIVLLDGLLPRSRD